MRGAIPALDKASGIVSFFTHSRLSPARLFTAGLRLTHPANFRRVSPRAEAAPGRGFAVGFPALESEAEVGDPLGRRILFLHHGPGAWWRLLDDVPSGQEWVTVSVAPAMAAARLRPLLPVRDGRKPILVAGERTLALAVRVAVDCPEAVGGLMIVADMIGVPGWRRRLGHWLDRPAVPDVLAVSDGDLGAIRVPVTLVQGTAGRDGLLVGALERGLTSCRTLMVVEVPGADCVRPRSHPAELRAALAALLSAVERGGSR